MKNKFEEAMVAEFGLLMSPTQLAKLLGRSPEALRAHLTRYKNDNFCKSLNGTSVKVGRRVYYRTPEVAEILACQA
ncbi:plasmid-related protein [Pseudomonas sp. NPDC089554]|uniref:plasmid-related protein n=1 Tax=Pseudomonas sp. NPDC089554 TaxID=3390653 RepID=UPI003D019694